MSGRPKFASWARMVQPDERSSLRRFKQMIEVLEMEDGIIKKYMIPTTCKFQFTMVARLDDPCRFEEEDMHFLTRTWKKQLEHQAAV